jgi:omega-6 fatty acid desaturase (delta-12 desaturase)
MKPRMTRVKSSLKDGALDNLPESAARLKPRGWRPDAPISLAALARVIPHDCFRPDAAKAAASSFGAAAFLLAALAFGAVVWSSPGLHLLAPVSWCVSGTAFMSCFVLGHDCGHSSLTGNRRLNVVLGHLFFLPAFFPFYPWKRLHDAHHRHTNRLYDPDPAMTNAGDDEYDNAWQPLTTVRYVELAGRRPSAAWIYRAIRGCPPLGTLYYLARHFDVRTYRGRDRRRMYGSLAFLVAAASAVLFALTRLTGSPVLAALHFWIIPALMFHVWLGLYTFTQHVSADSLLHTRATWTPFRAQVESTANCLYPDWLSVLHFRIDYHVPHHLAPRIPSYCLQRANDALMASEYKGLITECRFSIGQLVRNLKLCQLWDVHDARYVTFAENRARLRGDGD